MVFPLMSQLKIVLWNHLNAISGSALTSQVSGVPISLSLRITWEAVKLMQIPSALSSKGLIQLVCGRAEESAFQHGSDAGGLPGVLKEQNTWVEKKIWVSCPRSHRVAMEPECVLEAASLLSAKVIPENWIFVRRWTWTKTNLNY